MFKSAPVTFNFKMLNTVPEIKKEFFAFRNGIISDALRKNGDPHKFIMGCQLVDVISIASRTEHSVSIACEMWSDINHRECRMIAPMLYPADEMNLETASKWVMEVECNEIADVLCHRLLRYLPFAEQLAFMLLESGNNQVKYTGWRLILNILCLGKDIDKSALKTWIDKTKAAQPQRDIAQLLSSIEEEL